MTTDIKKDRSPKCPRLPLEDAIILVQKLYAKVGKAKVKQEVAIAPLGYTSMNGAALTVLGALNSYGLIDRNREQGISISQLAMRILHPTSPEQQLAAKQEAALKPRVFSELLTGGFHTCAEEVLANHLIQAGFTAEGARRAASAYKANATFAQITETTAVPNGDATSSAQGAPNGNLPATSQQHPPEASPVFPAQSTPVPAATKILAQYSIPLGANDATLVFTGEKLSPEDFDALSEYVALFKKQYERKVKASEFSALSDAILPRPPAE